jgi:hypothetical protein
MKYATVEDVVDFFLHPILPKVQGEPDYQTIHGIQKLLQANARAIETHLGGRSLGHRGLIVYDASYTIIAQTGENGPLIWTNPTAPGRAPEVFDQGTSAQLSAVRNSWEEAFLTYRNKRSINKSSLFLSLYTWKF